MGKTRIVKSSALSGALVWLGFAYTKDDNGNFIFERDIKFDKAFKDLHALRANYIIYEPIK